MKFPVLFFLLAVATSSWGQKNSMNTMNSLALSLSKELDGPSNADLIRYESGFMTERSESIYDILKIQRGLNDAFLDNFNFEVYGGTPIFGIKTKTVNQATIVKIVKCLKRSLFII